LLDAPEEPLDVETLVEEILLIISDNPTKPSFWLAHRGDSSVT
jgi:hypothetical protein